MVIKGQVPIPPLFWDAHRFHRAASVDVPRDDDDSSGRGGLEEKGVVVGAFVWSGGWSWNNLYVAHEELLRELAGALVRHRCGKETTTTSSARVLIIIFVIYSN